MLRVNQLIGFGARPAAGGGSVAAPVVVERSTYVEAPGSGSYTTSAKPIGTAAGDRVVIVPVSMMHSAVSDRHITALTIGGVTATKRAGATGASGDFSSEVWTATVPTGTTAALAFTFTGGAPAQVMFTIVTATGLTTEAPDVSGASQGGASALSVSLVTTDKCLVIGCFGQKNSAAAPDFDTGIVPIAGVAYQSVGSGNGNHLAGIQHHTSSGSKTFAMAAQVTSSQAVAACGWYAASSTLSGPAFSNTGSISGSWVASYGATVAFDEIGLDTVVSGASTGTAAADRITVVAICYKSNSSQRTITACQINGIAATLTSGSYVNSDPYCDIWYAANPTGTTGDIKFTANNANVNVEAVHVFRIVGQSQNAPFSAGSMEDASGSKRICLPASSFAIGASGVNSSGSATTLSGLTADDTDRTADNGTVSVDSTAGHATGTGSNSTLSIGSNRGRLTFAVWVGGSTTDIYYSSVVSLLHFEGADNSTTYTDQTGKTWTAHNIAVIDTAQFKFGSSSGLFQRGATIYIDTPHSTDWNFGSDDFTVECWVRWNDLTGTNLHGLIFHDNPSGTRGWGLYMNDAGSNQDLLSFFGNFGGSNKTVTDTVVVTTGQWYHIAAVRDGNTLRLYKNGIQVASDATLSGSVGAPSEPLAVGCQWGNGVPLASSSLDGWIDDLRITKGVCRYPGGTTFPPPIASFPDS